MRLVIGVLAHLECPLKHELPVAEVLSQAGVVKTGLSQYLEQRDHVPSDVVLSLFLRLAILSPTLSISTTHFILFLLCYSVYPLGSTVTHAEPPPFS